MAPRYMIFYLNSYFLAIEHYPIQVEKLAQIISDEKGVLFKKENFPIVEYVNNMLKKLGYMILAKDCLSKKNVTRIASVWHDFIFNNFVYDAKAFLDSVAMTLKFVYDVDVQGGNIDLAKDSFLNQISKVDSNLVKDIKKHQNWINDVVKWRMDLIHRLTTPVVPIFPGDPSDEEWVKIRNQVNIPMEPISMFKIHEESARLKKKYGKVMQEAIPFCEEWISNGNCILELACKSLENKVIK